MATVGKQAKQANHPGKTLLRRKWRGFPPKIFSNVAEPFCSDWLMVKHACPRNDHFDAGALIHLETYGLYTKMQTCQSVL